MQDIDVAVIGAGPAGLTAGIYLGRARINTVVFEKVAWGGQMVISELVENFPGFPEGISGAELAERMKKQASGCGSRVTEEEISDIKKFSVKCPSRTEKCFNNFKIKTAGGAEYTAQAVIVATGAYPKKLGVAGEDIFIGRGVSYCATCDGPLFKDKTAAVVGGGDTAVQEALFLARYSKKVYLVHRRDRLRATKAIAERLSAAKNIQPLWNSVVVEIFGDKKVRSANVKDLKTGRMSAIECDGVFVFAGIVPASRLAKGLVKMDAEGYIITDEDMKTSCEGVFACGDVRKRPLRQIVTACGEAATAAVSAQHYVEELKGTAY
jgi:thioredoxin reductase (NADPH)